MPFPGVLREHAQVNCAPAIAGNALRVCAVKYSHEWQPTSVLITVGGYRKPVLQISALDTNISNFKKIERKESEEIKPPSFTFLRNMKSCF